MPKQSFSKEYEVNLPSSSVLSSDYEKAYFADSYAILLPPGTIENPEVLARFLLSHSGLGTRVLMRIRDTVMGALGYKTAKGFTSSTSEPNHERIQFFKIYQKLPNEIILGEDDKHLDFRISGLIRQTMHEGAIVSELVVTTVVQCHNLLGRTYIRIIKPFHSQIVRAYIRRSAKEGWPN